MNQQETSDGAESRSQSQGWGRRVILGLAILLLLALAAKFVNPGADAFTEFVSRLEGLGPWGPVVFISAYAVAVLAFVPGSLLTLTAGALFGIMKGTLYVFAAACMGSWLAFLVGRHVARDAVEKRIQSDPRYAAIDTAVAEQGLKIVLLLRLSPVFPFNLLNYALGLTKIRFSDYAIASVGMLPGTLLYVYTGRLIGDVAAITSGTRTERGIEEYALLGLGALATLMVVVLVTRTARRALDRSNALVSPSPNATPPKSPAPSPASTRNLE